MVHVREIVLCCVTGRSFYDAVLGDRAVLNDFESVLDCVIGRSLCVVWSEFVLCCHAVLNDREIVLYCVIGRSFYVA